MSEVPLHGPQFGDHGRFNFRRGDTVCGGRGILAFMDHGTRPPFFAGYAPLNPKPKTECSCFLAHRD